MNISFIPQDTQDQKILNLAKAIQSGEIPPSPRVPAFEDMIAKYCGTSKAVAVNSNSAALELIFNYFGIGPKDEVIVSVFANPAIVAVINKVGAKIVMCDVKRGTFLIESAEIEKRITSHTKAVIVSKFGGAAPDYDRIYDIIYRKKNKFTPQTDTQKCVGRIAVIADATHSFGAVHSGKKVGTHADFTVFSISASCGNENSEGSAITWTHHEGIDDQELYNWFTQHAHYGKQIIANDDPVLNNKDYDILCLSTNSGMSDINAAVGIQWLMNFESEKSKRRQIIDEYDRVLLPLGIERQNHFPEGSEDNAQMYLMHIPGITEKQRNDIMGKLAEAGIETNICCRPLPIFTAYKELGFNIAFYPNAYAQYCNEIALPLYTGLTKEEVSYIAQTVKNILKGTYLKTAPKELNLKQANVNRRQEIYAVQKVLKDCGNEMFQRYNQLYWLKPPHITEIDHDAVNKYVYLVNDENDNTVATFNISENPIKYPRYFKPDRDAIYIDKLGVVPSLWRRGVGSRLLSMIEERAKKENCECLRCIVDAETNGYYFLKKHGFRILQRQDGKYGEQYFIEKDL